MSDKFDPEQIITTIKRFLTNMMLRAGSDGYVVGLSGGIDSSLSATLAVEAVGSEKVFGVMMPYKSSSDSSITDAKKLVEMLKIDYTQIDISPMIDIYYEKIDNTNRLRAGNKMARERMSILFDKAHEMNRLVLGTGNRTEICLGYTTWYGDSACSVNPLGELYKSEVRQLSKILGIPNSIINKPPTADLWEGQTDEGEIGITYEQIDNLLIELIDNNIHSISKLEQKSNKSSDISRVVSLINSNFFKRKLPEIAPLKRPSIPDNIQLEE